MGYPHGTVLESLQLFLSYVYTILVQNVPDISTRHFADDTNVFLFGHDCSLHHNS